MPRASRKHDQGSNEAGDEFALSSQQLGAVKDPRASIHAMIAAHPIWHDDPELARSLNDRLAARD